MRKKKGGSKTVLVIVAVALVIAGLCYFSYAYFQAEELVVIGNGKYTEVYIRGLAAIAPNSHMFTLDTDAIGARIEDAEPYLEVLAVRKELPRKVVVEVRERQPKALLPYSQNYLLTDKEAVVLEMVTTVPEDGAYPVVEGITLSAASLGRQVTTEDAFKISVMGEILTALENRKMSETLSVIDLSDINNIRMKASSGLDIKFGQADRIADKVKWIDTLLPRYAGRTDGLIDVSVKFPIFELYDDSVGGDASTGEQDGGTQQTTQGGDGATENDATEGNNADGEGQQTEPQE